MAWIIRWSLENRFLVIVLTLLLAGIGVVSVTHLPLDAFPDTTPVQVQVNTVVPALSPQEVESQVTFPLEQAVTGMPGLENVRSVSKFGFSQVTAIFQDGTDLYRARQMVSERLSGVELPEGVGRPELGPPSTGLGEVFHYLLTGKGVSLNELTALQEWVVKPQLAAVSGVAEVNTWGGSKKQIQVRADPERLLKYDLTFEDLLESLRKNNANVGGGGLSSGGEFQLVQGVGLISGRSDLETIVIGAQDGVPIRIRDVASVEEGHEIRRGAVTADGKGEAVLGLGFMLTGENSKEVTERLSSRLKEAKKSLPSGVEIQPVYKRTDLVSHVLRTVRENLFEGAILVVAVLFLFLGNFRAAFLTALAIPLSMLFAFNLMLKAGVAGSLMSLGAIDFGLVVDSSVILIENVVRRLGLAKEGEPAGTDLVCDAALEVRKPTMFGELIIMIVYLPILTLEGIEGKLFRPMALTVIFALLGSLIFSLTLMPVLASFFLSGKKSRKPDREALAVRGAKWLYRPILSLTLKMPGPILAGAAALLLGAGILFLNIGSQFIPRLSEESLVINTIRLSGVSLEESARYGTQIEKLLLRKFPDEIEHIWTRSGSPSVVTDPMGLELSDVFITLTPRERWKKARTQEALEDVMKEALSGLPGMRTIFTQPIEMRVSEMTAGIRGDLGVQIFGDDLEVLKEKAGEVDRILRSLFGSSEVGATDEGDVAAEQITGQPIMELVLDHGELGRLGIRANTVLDLMEAVSGKKVGELREGQRRYDLTVNLEDRYRTDPLALSQILIPGPSGERIPISKVAQIREKEGPSTIQREWGKRRIVVQCNVQDKDLAGFVKRAQERITSSVRLPAGYYFRWGGQFEHLLRARERLFLVVPLALFLILALLYLSFHSVRDALLVFTGAPFACVGGIMALHVSRLPFTISAGVGFIALFGVAVLNGLVLISYIRQLAMTGTPLPEAIQTGCLARLRPVLLTALVASLGFLPMALNTGVGAEVQRPLATVVIGGIFSSTVMTLLVLPVLYRFFGEPAGKKG
ncbi:MAG: efflux RND transporter permease subunit [Armatimonadetes bacterium]|nr:efflux RND transporter permease subunit [Armatimonadota bacterium]